MTKYAQTTLLFHGTIILLGSMLTGFPLAVAAADGWPPEAIHAWSVAHSSLASSGILLIAVAAAAQHLALSRRQPALFCWTLLSSVYSLNVGLVTSATTGLRGINPAGPTLNLILYSCNVVGVFGALVAGVLLVRGAYASLRAEAAISRQRPIGTHATNYAA